MTDQKVYFYDSTPWSSISKSSDASSLTAAEQQPRIDSSTCTEAETFALRVLDESMQPEFRRGCIIVIDPTGHATDGSFVLARCVTSEVISSDAADDMDRLMEEYVFRQLQRVSENQWELAALNGAFPSRATASDFSEIVGVVVQRAGTRRRYHKHYA